MAINIMCMNDNCKYYYEDSCMRNINEERIEIDEYGRCKTFCEGINEAYNCRNNCTQKDCKACKKEFSSNI